MATSRQSISRVTINDLPEAQAVKDDDYILLQSDGVSSKIQISNIRLDRENINFYNEIATLNRESAENSIQLKQLKEQIELDSDMSTQSVTGTDEQSTTTTGASSRVEQVENTVKTLETKTSALEATTNSTKQRVETINTNANDKIASLQKELDETKSSLGEISSASVESYTEFVGGISKRVTDLEARMSSLESSFNSVAGTTTSFKKQIAEASNFNSLKQALARELKL